LKSWMEALYSSLAKQKVNEKKNEYLQEKLGIEAEGDASTKDILKGLLMKEVLDEEETTSTDSLNTPDATAAKTNVDADVGETEVSAEEETPLTKKELREERKRQLLESLFN